MEALEMFKSKWCWVAASIGLAIGLVIVWPVISAGELGWRLVPVLAFLALFPVSLACNIRLAVKRARAAKLAAQGIISIILYVLGFTAAQSCLAGFCSVSLGISLLAFLPASISAFFYHNSPLILAGIDLLLLLNLKIMGCLEGGRGLRLKLQ